MKTAELPLVSVIVTTRNNADVLPACLQSIAGQTYQPIELLVVDNGSTDDTKIIAASFTGKVFDKGPERSAQRNFAVEKAGGTYVLIIDSDMELSKEVVGACVAAAEASPETGAFIIPEESFGTGYWAQCKKLERSFYVGQDDIEAARFFRTDIYRQAGGYNEAMTGAEDWDFTDRIRKLTHIGRVEPYIYHNEGHYKLSTALKKKFYYTKGFMRYYDTVPADQPDKPQQKSALAQALGYYKLYLGKPGKLFRNPAYGFGVLFMKTAEFATSFFSLLSVKLNNRKPEGELH